MKLRDLNEIQKLQIQYKNVHANQENLKYIRVLKCYVNERHDYMNYWVDWKVDMNSEKGKELKRVLNEILLEREMEIEQKLRDLGVDV